LVREGLAGFDVSQLGRGVGCRKTADTAAVHPGGCYDASSGPVSGAKRCTYEPPKLVNLSESAAVAHGSCENGSGDFGNCFNGPAPGSQCGNGNVAPNSACCTGSAPAWASNCQAGTCAHRAAACAPGGTICSFGTGAGGEPCSP
jgi:hypothetical protein